MPFEEAKTYRFNPFDLTKVWPHADYPLIEVGTLVLDRNVADAHTEMEQAAFEPNNQVPGTGLSPDRMLLARGFSYADAHRARLGVNYKQIPVNSAKVEVHSYSKDGVGRTRNASTSFVRLYQIQVSITSGVKTSPRSRNSWSARSASSEASSERGVLGTPSISSGWRS